MGSREAGPQGPRGLRELAGRARSSRPKLGQEGAGGLEKHIREMGPGEQADWGGGRGS
jgi:hypothetical protein